MSSPTAAAAAADEDYAALMRGDITISDVTSDEGNAEVLRDLKDNNPDIVELCMKGGNAREDECPVFDVYDTRALGVLGFFLGRSANVMYLYVQLPLDLGINIIEPFLLELQNNRSIRTLNLVDSHIPHDFFRILAPFIASNPNLVDLDVSGVQMDAEQYRLLSLALREGNSLKRYYISGLSGGGCYDHEESIIDNIEALKMHLQLETLFFGDFTLGRSACTALSDLLRQSSRLEMLVVNDSDIDDTGVEALVGGLARCSQLRQLYFCGNISFTIRGWRALSTLLEDQNVGLQIFSILRNGIDDERAILFANALVHNNTLEKLILEPVGITPKGWAAFSKALCDTSSVNNTFLSNHTLQDLGQSLGIGRNQLPRDIISLLTLNKQDNKARVAFQKVLRCHNNFDMQPLFEWDLKALPLAVGWLERAATYRIETEDVNRKRKLAAIYQFIRGMPELTVDGITGASTKSSEVGGEKRPHSTAFE